MTTNSSVGAFIRTFNERFGVFESRFEKLIVTLTENQHDKKLDGVRELAQALDDLKRMLSTSDKPGWIAALENALVPFNSNPNQPHIIGNLIIRLVDIRPQIKSQDWTFLQEPSDDSVDFDGIFKSHLDQSKIPELFDELVTKLQRVVDSGQVDSMRALKAMEKLIATLRRNARGSFFSMLQTKDFAHLLVRNILCELATEIPIVGSLIEGIRKTMKDMDIAFDELQAGMKPNMEHALEPFIGVRSLSLDDQSHAIKALPPPNTNSRNY